MAFHQEKIIPSSWARIKNRLFSSTEGKLDKFCLEEFVPDLDINDRIQGGRCRLYIAHPDRFTERRALRAGRDAADGPAGRVFDLIIVARNPLVDHFKTDQLAGDAGCLLFFQDLPGGEVFGEFRDPAQTGLKGAGAVVDIISVETIPHFKPEGIPGPQPDGPKPLRRTHLEDTGPDLFGGVILVFKIDLDPARPRIAGGADEDIVHAGEPAL